MIQTFVPLAIAVGLALGARAASGDDLVATVPTLGILLWLLSIAILFRMGFSSLPKADVQAKDVLVVLILAGCALLVRSFRLSSPPPILSGNEASFGLAAIEFIDGTRSNPFNTAWGSFPSLYPFLQSIPITLLGRSLPALRLSSVLAGTLTVVATYAYAKLAFGRRVAIISGIVIALLGFHVHFSRLGLNNIWDALFAVVLGFTLSLAWRAGRPAAFALPGLVLGLAQFFYVGSRVFFLLIALWAAAMVSLDRRRMGPTVKGGAVLLVSATAVFMPLALFFVAHPSEYWAPISRASVFGRWWMQQTMLLGDPSWWVAAEQLLRGVLGFVAVPLTQFFAGQPLLSPPLAILFVLGLLVVAFRIREPETLWIAFWILGSVAAVALSVDAPAGQRYASASAAVSIVIALGLEAVLARVRRFHGRTATVVHGTAAGLVLIALLWQLVWYFRTYPALEALADFNAATVASTANAIRQSPSVRKVYFFVSPRLSLASNEVVRFLLPKVGSEDIPDDPQWQVTVPGPGTYAFSFLLERQATQHVISTCFPGGTLSADRTPEGYLLSMVYIAEIPTASQCISP